MQTVEEKIAEILGSKCKVMEDVTDPVVNLATTEGEEDEKEDEDTETDADMIAQDEGDKEVDSDISVKAPGSGEIKVVMSKESFASDIEAMTEGFELSDEFKARAAVIFEAAVDRRVAEIKKVFESKVRKASSSLDEEIQSEASNIQEEIQTQAQEIKSQIQESSENLVNGLVDKIDSYMDYVVEQWFDENRIAVESGLRMNIMEDFVSGMKGLFERHYIDVPDTKLNVLTSLEESNTVLKSKLNKQLSNNIEMKKQLQEMKKESVVNSLSEGLTPIEKDKFKGLVENISYEDSDSFEKKAKVIKESYFKGKKASSPKSEQRFITESVVVEEETPAVSAPNMKQYLSVLDHLTRK